MGRIAEALQRAERRRWGESHELDGIKRHWSNWYGAAEIATPDQPELQPRALSPPDPVAGMSETIVSYYQRSSPRCEQYRSLRTRLISANPRREHRIYTISSAVPKEGKSITAVNLAFSMAEIPGSKVLLVDADFRRAALARLLNRKSAPGLAELLDGRESPNDVIHATALPNLVFVPAGKTRGRSATELLSGKRTRTAFARFQRDYNYTIVDTPPVTTVADVGIIGQMTHGVIFLIRMHRTPEPLARRAIKEILNNNITIIGGLLIGEDDPTTGDGRQYDYDRYYSKEEDPDASPRTSDGP